MKRYDYLNGKYSQWIVGAFLMSMLFLSRDSLAGNTLIGFTRASFLMAAFFAVLVVGFVWQNRHQMKQILLDRRIGFAAVCTGVILLPMVVKRDWQLMYFSVLICLYMAIFLSYFRTIRETARIYVLIMTFLGAYSLLTSYLLRIPADRGILVPPVFQNYTGFPFYNYLFSYVSVDYVKNRNFGIFREPGVHQYFVMLAIYLNNYHVDYKRQASYWIVNGILVATLLSTFATGAVLTLGLLIVVVYLDKKWYATPRGKWIAAAIVAAGAAAVTALLLMKGELYMELYRMVEKFFNGSDSITDRLGSFVVNFRFFFAHPLVGTTIRETLYAIENNTSSSTILFAIAGVFGGLLHVGSWFCLVWKRERNLCFNLLITAILAVSFNTQNLITNPYLWIFPIMAVVDVLPERKG